MEDLTIVVSRADFVVKSAFGHMKNVAVADEKKAEFSLLEKNLPILLLIVWKSSHNILRTMINNAASDLVDLMDSSGNGVVEWNEFRMHQRIVSERVKQLRDFVMHLVDQDEAEGIHEFEFRKGESMKVLTGLEQPLESQDIVSHHQQHPTSKTSKKPASSISAKSKAGKKTGTGTKTKTPSSPPKPTLNKKVA